MANHNNNKNSQQPSQRERELEAQVIKLQASEKALIEKVQPQYDVRSIIGAANVQGSDRYTITVTKDGEVESVAPTVVRKDLLVDCKEKHRRCVAAFRIHRINEEHERLVCIECVGSGNQNKIMVKL